MEDFLFHEDQDQEQDERQEIQTLILSKKEKFRAKIRQTKNKQLIQAKRMRNIQDEQCLQKLSKNIKLIQNFESFTKEEVITALMEIQEYLQDGSFHQDIENLTQIASQLNSLIQIDAKTQINTLDSNLVKNAAITILNITQQCDDQQIKYFSTKQIINSVMEFFFYEDIQIRENSIVILNKIINTDKNSIEYLMEKSIATEIINIMAAYPKSDQFILDIASLIRDLVNSDEVEYSQTSEFLVSIDEIINIIVQSRCIEDETENGTLGILFEAIYLILIKENNEDIYEDFIIQYPRIIGNIVDIVSKIKYNQKFNNAGQGISNVIGVLLSGNLKTTQMLVNNNIFETLKILIQHPCKQIRKEALWSVSNLFVFTKVDGFEDYLKDLDFWETVLNLAQQDFKSVSKWAYVSILNAIVFNDIEFIELILERFDETEMIKFIFEKLKDNQYQNVIVTLLEALKSLIGYGKIMQKQNNYEENHIIVLIQRTNSKQILEQYQDSFQDNISKPSSYILDKII